MAETSARSSGQGSSVSPILIVFAAWLVPGLGHLLLRRWGRALVLFLAVGALAGAGLLLRGNLFQPHSGDPFDLLGYLADIGSGMFYFLGKSIEAAGADVSHAAGDYGTRFIATAGVVNVLCVLDAYEIARRRKA